MEADFWIQRWERNEIGFHQAEINAHLQEFWPSLGTGGAGEVLVPLCGKSRDILWLRSRGHRVLGVEVSERAVRAFFEENRLQPHISRSGPFGRWECDGITILCGDFFDLEPADLKGVAGVYDRASLVALPAAMRERYAARIAELLSPGVDILLVTMEYPQEQMDGPPFAVEENEVHRLYDGAFEIERLFTRDILTENPRFQERGLTRLEERVYRLARKS